MSIYSILAVILGVLAGVINLSLGVMRRAQPLLALMRFGAALVGFAAPVVILVAHSQGLRLVPTEWHNAAYLLIALAIFVGVTLMVPATIERSALAPAPVERKTGPLTAGQSGVRIANESGDDWVK